MGTHRPSFNALPLRFIPAHAGNSPSIRAEQSVHPRACGELYAIKQAAVAVRFIPAHAGNSSQGRAGRCSPFIPAMRFTPRATAEGILQHGSSPRMRGTHRKLRLFAPVHPRACGELMSTRAFKSGMEALTGSSPRMRGTPIWPDRHGSSRMRGNRRHHASTANVHGSSPRMRGTHATTCRFGRGSPGNSTIRFRKVLSPVHPRACGELN